MVIDSEFAITKAPTKSATRPNPSRNLCRNAEEVGRVRGVLAGSLCRRPSSPECPSEGSLAPARRVPAGVTPDFAAMRIWSSCPTLSKRLCAVGRSKPARVAPPIERHGAVLERSPRSGTARPGLSTARRSSGRPGGPSSRRWTRRRRARPCPGQAPFTRVSELNCGCVGSTLKPRFGAPPKTIAFPFSPMRCALSLAHRRSRRRRREAPYLLEQ